MIVVTGATGFVGGAVAQALVARGERVRAVVRRTSDARALRAAGVETCEGDVITAAGLGEALAGATAVIHSAGMLGRAGAEDSEYLRIHVDGTLNVVRAARAAGIARLVHVSSPGLLGPIPRGAPDADEDAPPAPTNPYERSKAEAERAIAHEAAGRAPIAIVVRPEFVYGPGDLHVLRLFQAIKRRRFFYIGSGDALCHPTYIDDAVRGLLAALDRGAAGRVYHVAGPRPVSVRQLAETFARALGVSPPFVHVPERPLRAALSLLEPLARRAGVTLPIGESAVDFFTRDRHFSHERARRELSYEPSIDVGEGAQRAADWYAQRGLL